MADYYDREGNRIGMMEWASRQEGGKDARRVDLTTLSNNGRVVTVIGFAMSILLRGGGVDHRSQAGCQASC